RIIPVSLVVRGTRFPVALLLLQPAVAYTATTATIVRVAFISSIVANSATTFVILFPVTTSLPITVVVVIAIVVTHTHPLLELIVDHSSECKANERPSMSQAGKAVSTRMSQL